MNTQFIDNKISMDLPEPNLWVVMDHRVHQTFGCACLFMCFKRSHQMSVQVASEGLCIQLLFCTAGIMFWPWELTEDGHEAHWSVNYLGHFLLTHLLLPSLIATADTTNATTRVVNLTSSVHYIGSINFQDAVSL